MVKPLYIMDTEGAGIYARSLAATAGLTVVFFDEDGQPYTDPVRKTLHVQKPQWQWDEKRYAIWNGTLLHELGHHRGNNGALMDGMVKRKINTKSLYGAVVNILLDWINDAQWAAFPGANSAVEACQMHYAGQGIARVKESYPKDDKSKLMVTVFSWIYNQRALTYQKGLLATAFEWQDVVPFDSLDVHTAELRALLKSATAESVISLTDKIVPPEHHPDEEEEGEEEGGGEEGDGEGDPEDGDSESGEGDGPDDGDDSESSDKDGEGEGKKAWVSYRDLLLADRHDTRGKPGRAVVITYDHDWADNYEPLGNPEIIDLSEVVK